MITKYETYININKCQQLNNMYSMLRKCILFIDLCRCFGNRDLMVEGKRGGGGLNGMIG